ncbi:serine/threonine-protein kinase [Micromonospora sonneratiae]|uniref:non-specific serine/threonine protein kinase n=1 Tax=Micromonospora sonneratiae TaxID=1184706 RepID=A0ABW3Y9W7_9ACTN
MTDTPPGALPLPVVPGLTDLKVFARGGYATVYRAVQQSVGREVAVKVENRTLDSERDQQRFLREARAAGRMSSHPHVVDLFDVGVTVDQHPYLIMELCDGSYLERMRTSPLGAAEARDLGVKIADALAHSHGAGVLHRDVKPANILHSNFNPAVLADFGLAVLAEMRDASVALEVLTPAYAAPEMFRHSPPSPAVDVYALCATLYAVMQGKPPRWQEDRNPSLITLLEMFDQPIPDLPDVPPAMIDVLRAGMANDPGDRPTAEQLRDLLTSVPLGPSAGGAIPSMYGWPISPAAGWPPVQWPGPGASCPGASGSGASGAGRSAPGTPGTGMPGTGLPGAHHLPGATGQAYQLGVHQPPAQPTPPRPGAQSAPGAVYGRDDVPGAALNQRRNPLRWFLGGLGMVAVAAAAGTGAWVASGRPNPRPSPTHAVQSSDTPTPAPSVVAGGALPGCLVELPGGSRCSDELECFGPVQVRGSGARAVQVPCSGRHTWESYAEGDLPAEVVATDHRAVKADPTVRRVCAETTFRSTTLQMTVDGWHFEVLPPPEESMKLGQRTFRCLAGKGTNQLLGPTLGR